MAAARAPCWHDLMPRPLALALFVIPSLALASPTVVISIDGLAWDTWKQQHVRMPNLAKLASRGSVGPLRTTFPSMTWPAHVSMVTGVLPNQHGVPANAFRERGRKVEAWELSNVARVPALWDALAAKGRTTAAVFWPGSGGIGAIRWNLPETYTEEIFTRDVSAAMRDELTALGFTPESLKPLAAEETFLEDRLSRELGLRLVRAKSADLILLHLLSVDTWSHKLGPRHPAVGFALELVDGIVGDWVHALDETHGPGGYELVVVSDHGFAETSKPIPLETLVAAAPLPAVEQRALEVIPNGHCAFFYGVRPERVAGLASWLSSQPGVERVLSPGDFSALGLAPASVDPRSPDIILVAKPDTLPIASRKTTLGARGGHGTFPTHPAMLGIVIHAGPTASSGVNAAMPITELAPRLAKALGLAWPPSAR